MTDRILTLHSVWDADHPEDAAYRRVTHPDSEHPCPGKLIVEDTSDPAPSIVGRRGSLASFDPLSALDPQTTPRVLGSGTGQ